MKCCSARAKEPLITLGPDLLFSIGLLTVVDVLIYLLFKGYDSDNVYFWVSRIIAALFNTVFILTVACNQGMLSRDPGIHSLRYL